MARCAVYMTPRRSTSKHLRLGGGGVAASRPCGISNVGMDSATPAFATTVSIPP